jgi:hypothetical protein
MSPVYERKAAKLPRPGGEIIPLPWTARRRRTASKSVPAHPADPDDYPVSDRTLLTIGTVLALCIVGCVWLLETMRENARLEECLMAGHKNCARLELPATDR